MLRLLGFVLGLTLLVPFATAQDGKKNPLIAKLEGKKITGPFTLVVTFTVKKGEEKALMDLAKPCVEATRKEKGCIHYDLQQDLDDPTKFILYERWKSPAALEAHMAEEHTKKLLASWGKHMDGPASVRLYLFAEDR